MAMHITDSNISNKHFSEMMSHNVQKTNINIPITEKVKICKLSMMASKNIWTALCKRDGVIWKNTHALTQLSIPLTGYVGHYCTIIITHSYLIQVSVSLLCTFLLYYNSIHPYIPLISKKYFSTHSSPSIYFSNYSYTCK